MLPSASVKECKNTVPFFHSHVEVVGNGASGGPEHSDPTFRLASRRECRDGERLADALIMPFSGCGALCSTEPSISRFSDIQGRTEIWRRSREGQYSRVATERPTNILRNGRDMVPTTITVW